MAVPTIVLDEDVKELKGDVKTLREDLHKVEVSLTNKINDVLVKVEKLASRFNIIMGIFGVVLSATLGIAIMGLVNGSYWAGSLNKGMTELEKRFDKLEDRFDKFENRFDKLESRFDKLDAALTKIAEQLTPPKTTKAEPSVVKP